MDGCSSNAQPHSEPQPETVVSPAANDSPSPTTLAKAALASPTLNDWFKWSPGEKNLENLAQLAFPEVYDLDWGFDLTPAEEDGKEDHHDGEEGASPSKDQAGEKRDQLLRSPLSTLAYLNDSSSLNVTPPYDTFVSPSPERQNQAGEKQDPFLRSPLSTLAYLNDFSSLNVTPPYDTFASPSPERSPYYYSNGNDSKDDSEADFGSDHSDEYAAIGIDLTKYVGPNKNTPATHQPMCQPF